MAAQNIHIAGDDSGRHAVSTSLKSSPRTEAYRRLLLLTLSCVFLSTTACSSQREAPSEFGQPREVVQEQQLEAAANRTPGQEALLRAQANQSSKVQVLFSAPVLKLLAEDRQGIPHQRFLLQLSNGTTVLVAHNTRMAPSVPIKPGDILVIKGEYVWNPKGGVVHWTHHSDNARHAGGYILLNGKKYE